MKILYITQLYPPLLYGGGEYIFSKWAEEMARRGHEIGVLTQKVEGTEGFEVLNGVKIYRVLPEIKYEGSLYSIGMLHNLGYLVNSVIRGLSVSKEYDIIHSNTFIPTFTGAVLSKLRKKPHVETIFDVYLQTDKDFWKKWSQQEEVSFITGKIGKFFERLILKFNPARIHTSSLTSKEDLIKEGIKPESIEVIHLGLNLEDYDVETEKVPYQICYIGRLIFYKNIETVIKAFKKVIETIPLAKFIIAGKGPYEKNLQELVEKLNLGKNIIFSGRISHKEKLELLAGSQVMVQPSLVEGFGITVIEAHACGTPVLVSQVMPLPELVKNRQNGATIAPFNETLWADKILEYLANPEECSKQGKRGRKMVEDDYTIKVVVDRFEKLYGDLIDNK